MTQPELDSLAWTATRRAVLTLGGTLALGALAGARFEAPSPLEAFAGPYKGRSRSVSGVVIHMAHADVGLSFATPGVVSVTKTRPGELHRHPGLFEPKGRVAVEISETETGEQVELRAGDVWVTVGKATGALWFATANGIKLRESQNAAVKAAVLRGLESFAAQLFEIAPDDALYGLGQFSHPFFNYRDKRVFLAHANYDTCNPVLVSTGGWGLFWDNQTAGYFSSKDQHIGLSTTNPRFIRYHVMLGESMDAAIAGFRRLTGTAALLGQWAYGYWQSKERYTSQDDLTGIVDEYRARHIPFDNIVQDWAYWGSQDWFSGMVWDKAHYPDPAAMAAHVHNQHAHIIVSIWPAFGPKSPIYSSMEAEGLLFPMPHWSGGRVYDATSPRARDIYWSYVKSALVDNGIDGFWTDGIEPEFMATGDRYGTMAAFAANGHSAAGPIKDNLLTFSYYQSLGLYEHMLADVPAKRAFILTRKAYAGQQAFAATTWSGDIYASWGTLHDQLAAGLNFSVSGIPYWTDDIGGFLVTHRFPGGLQDPAYRELYVRWFQFGAFMPIFRAHGTQIARELWQFGGPGDETYEALLAAVRLRYELMPYIYSMAAAITRKHDTLMRPLPMDFPRDETARAISTQFLFGRDLMVTVIDRPYFCPPAHIQEFIPNNIVTGRHGEPAATVTFFEGAHFDKTVSSRLTDELKMTWFGDLPVTLKGKPYSVEWVGCLTPPESGDYTFSFMGKGSMRLRLAGKIVLDHSDSTAASNDGANGGVAFKSHAGDWHEQTTVRLEADRAVEFELTQAQTQPDVVSTWVEWVTPSQREKMALPSRRTMRVYAPEGLWYDWHSREQIRGPGFVEREVRLRDHPVWVRAGAIIPTSPGIEYAQQTPAALHLRIFSGANGSFDLYQDSGDGHEYQRGVFASTAIRWDDATRTVTLDERQGSYEPIVGERTFIIELVGTDPPAPTRTVIHNGDALVIHF